MAGPVEKVKRRKTELEELLAIYPRLYNYDIAPEVLCGDINEDKLEHCKRTFERFCPVHFVVNSLEYVRCTEDPVCRWLVFYTSDNQDLLYEGPGLQTQVSLIMQQHPMNCEVLGKKLMGKKEILIEYGMVCLCSPAVFDLKDMRSPSCLDRLRCLSIGETKLN